MEPWDGPACVTFTDGSVIGAVLDRNGLRPARYWLTDDNLVVLASEVGVLDIDPSKVVRRGRLQPGRMFLVDLEQHRVVDDEEVKAELAAAKPYQEWLHAGLVELDELPEREHVIYSHDSVLRRQQTFGYTEEEVRVILAPMARSGAEPIGSMGSDTPVAVLSDRARLLYDYFSQLFAQVTNPPLDAIREELVTSLGTATGGEGNLLEPTPASCRQVVLQYPVLDNDELAKIVHINDDGDLPGFSAVVVRGLYPVAGGGAALTQAIERVRREVSDAIAGGAHIVVLSDRESTRRAGTDPDAAADQRRPRPSRTGEDAHPGGPDRRDRRRPRGAPHRTAHRLRRRRGQPVPRDGDGRGPCPRRFARQARSAQGCPQLRQGAEQGRAQGHVQDGHQHHRLVHRCPGVRGGRAVPGPGRRVLPRYDQPARRHRPRRRRGRGRHAPADRLPGRGGQAPHPRGRRRVPVAARGRDPPVQPRDGLQAAARDPYPAVRDLQGLHPRGRRAGRKAGDAARAVRAGADRA